VCVIVYTHVCICGEKCDIYRWQTKLKQFHVYIYVYIHVHKESEIYKVWGEPYAAYTLLYFMTDLGLKRLPDYSSIN
jgi:hypothetical protein